MDLSKQLQLDGTKLNTMFIEIELLFDAVPDTKFNKKIEDHLKISFRCGMHDLEIMQLICNTLNEYPPDKKQVLLLFIQRYQNINEIYFIKTLQIILYALMLTTPSRILEMKCLYKNGNELQIRVKSYREISRLSLAKKLALLQNMPPYYEFNKFAKLCTKDVRKAFGEPFNLENARELSEYILILLECFYYFSIKCYLKSKGLL